MKIRLLFPEFFDEYTTVQYLNIDSKEKVVEIKCTACDKVCETIKCCHIVKLYLKTVFENKHSKNLYIGKCDYNNVVYCVRSKNEK